MASEDDKEYIELESEGLEEDEADDDGGKKSENITDLFDVVISNPSPADKRAHHNALERKRRDHIKDSFVNLRECVPGISSDKASRAHILKKATDYIVMMKQKNMKHRNDIDSLRQQSRVMEEQVHALERIKATSMYAQSTQGLLKPGGPDQTTTITAPPQTSVDTLQQATEQLIQSSELESADNDGEGEGEVIIEQVVEEYPEAMEGATT